MTRFLCRMHVLGLFWVFKIGIQLGTVAFVVWLDTNFLHQIMDGSKLDEYANGFTIFVGLLSAEIVGLFLKKSTNIR